jgi:hypothetical protein
MACSRLLAIRLLREWSSCRFWKVGVKTMLGKVVCVIMFGVVASSLWYTSQWWEKALGTKVGASTISPNGCYRVDKYRPFWALPSSLHVRENPDADVKPELFRSWDSPGFYRLYDQRNERLIGSSKIYDLSIWGGDIKWGSSEVPEVYVDTIYVGKNLTDCIGDQPASYVKPSVLR